MEKVACIFGSTGLTGSYLLELLLSDSRYDKIIVFNRKKQDIEHQKVEQVVGDFSKLNEYSSKLVANEYYCCLGTTIKKAKTKEAFEFVDYQLPVQIGNLAMANNASHYLIVSSIGASLKSKNFYLRTKGRMEETVNKLDIANIFIFRPSLLLGERKENRLMEKISKSIMLVFGIFLFGPLKKFRAIHARTVAQAMMNSIDKLNGKQIIESDRIKQLVGN